MLAGGQEAASPFLQARTEEHKQTVRHTAASSCPLASRWALPRPHPGVPHWQQHSNKHGSKGKLTHRLWEDTAAAAYAKGTDLQRAAPGHQQCAGTRVRAAATGAAETATDDAAGAPSHSRLASTSTPVNSTPHSQELFTGTMQLTAIRQHPHSQDFCPSSCTVLSQRQTLHGCLGLYLLM